MKTTSASSRSVTRGHKSGANTKPATKPITTEEFDAKFNAGEDVSEHIDWSAARRPGREVQRVNVDFTIDMLQAIDAEATRLGVTRQSLIKIRMADALEKKGVAG